MCMMIPVCAIGIVCIVSWSKGIHPPEVNVWLAAYTLPCVIHAEKHLSGNFFKDLEE